LARFLTYSNKHSSLRQKLVNYGQKSFITLAPGTQGAKASIAKAGNVFVSYMVANFANANEPYCFILYWWIYRIVSAKNATESDSCLRAFFALASLAGDKLTTQDYFSVCGI
jgi:hypothetical protein